MAARSEELFGRDAEVIRFPRPRRVGPGAVVLRRRRAVALAVSFLLFVGLFLMATGPEGTALASRSGAPKVVRLQPGQGLWDVAERYAAPGQDLRAYVDALVELNDLGPVPQVGERLRLPR